MKKLELQRMEYIEGGQFGNTKANVACGIAIGLFFCGPIGIIVGCAAGGQACLIAAVAK